ncbi:MAG: GNAT family N-acetyltransferase [Betaproteobacteria bacterium]|nr:GNAT family N-acetyltransferase [Betaproteobacteria bacterium]
MCQNRGFTIDISAPNACNAAALAKFEVLVREGGEVDPNTIHALIERALSLAFVKSPSSLVGVGAIKRPNPSYRNRVFRSASSALNAGHFEFELGWVYVRPSAQGHRLASRLVQKLMPTLKGAAVYATSRVNNERMHASLVRGGFRQEGPSYPSKLNEPEIQLFVRT